MQKKNYIKSILPAVYGLCVFLFFWKMFPHHLHYQEQFQLFLYTKSYFIETCSRPGGFCNYAGRFFTQFYLSSLVGALLICCFLTGIQQLTYAIVRRFRRDVGRGECNSPLQLHLWSAGLFLSFLPSLFYWYLLCDENTQTGGVIALLFTLIAALVGTLFKSHLKRRIYLFASIPILYWLAGGTVVLSVLLLIGYEWYLLSSKSGDLQRGLETAPNGKKSKRKYLFLVFFSVAVVGFVFSLPFIAKYFLKQYPVSRYWWGVDYIHFVNFSSFRITYLWLLIILIVAGTVFFPYRKFTLKKTNPSPMQSFGYAVIQLFTLLFLSYFVILKIAYPKNLWKEEIMAYDYHCRMQNWNEVIKMADRKSPTVPITVACLNLSLYKTGQLSGKMFHYYQNGPEGLLPTFQRDFMIPMVGGEPYYYLGFVNTAQRFAFEAMEAFPDYQKSVRVIKRLAETNLINGYYEAASKYLYLLENTLFYRKWAKATRAFLYDDARIEAHPEWGKIRHFQTDEDFLFSGKEKDKMLGILFQQRRDNRMAYEYLMAYTLLTKDMRNFPVYFQLKKDFGYYETPKSWQEALVYIWGLSNSDLSTIPFPVSASVKREVSAYAQIYTSMKESEPLLRKKFPKTYWYYFHFRDYKQTNTESPLQY